jgi:hypothetical protein
MLHVAIYTFSSGEAIHIERQRHNQSVEVHAGRKKKLERATLQFTTGELTPAFVVLVRSPNKKLAPTFYVDSAGKQVSTTDYPLPTPPNVDVGCQKQHKATRKIVAGDDDSTRTRSLVTPWSSRSWSLRIAEPEQAYQRPVRRTLAGQPAASTTNTTRRPAGQAEGPEVVQGRGDARARGAFLRYKEMLAAYLFAASLICSVFFTRTLQVLCLSFEDVAFLIGLFFSLSNYYEAIVLFVSGMRRLLVSGSCRFLAILRF